MNMDMPQRLETFPADSYDVPLDQLIVRYGDGPAMQTAYHASPHKFDKFDMSKIGTGEGAQAYGHGLYMAESPAVSGRGGSYDREFTARALSKPDLNQQQEFILKHLDTGKNDMQILDAMAQNGIATDFDQAFSALNQMKAARSNVYKVDIPDEAIARMLDWDKPLNKRLELRDIVQKERPGYMTMGLPNDIITEADAYLSLAEKVGPAKAAEMFKEAGIPGIRYLDGSSRSVSGGELLDVANTPKGWTAKIRKPNIAGTVGDVIPQSAHFTTSAPFKTEQQARDWANQQIGGGTSNFVLFDDQMPRILEVNGQPTGLLPYADEAKAAKQLTSQGGLLAPRGKK
jgi:hypothetical protein